MQRNKYSDLPTDILLRNQIAIEEVRKINEDFTLDNKQKKHFNLVTYGCQMNEHDSEKLSAMLINMGYLPTDKNENADLVIFNTCCVRENAELKVFGNLGALKPLKQKNPNMIIAVCGCMMQQKHVVDEIKQKYRHVDLVFGTHNLHTFPLLLQETLGMSDMLVDVWEAESDIIEGLEINRKKEIKAYVNIMYGCNNFCTYCIVPYTRGRERSRKPSDIINEVKLLLEEGTKEIILLGQNVNSYGLDFDNSYSFADLLKEIDALSGKFRLRFMTSHPKDLSVELIEAIKALNSVCEYVHLPVQAGSNTLLKAMNRGYTREQYLKNVTLLKDSIPGVTLSTDIIIGFPGETEEDLEALIDLIKIVRYDAAFTFIYSKREGTPAAKMENQIDKETQHQRFEKMLSVLNEIIAENNKAEVGNVVEVLVEGKSRDGDYLMGRTRTNRIVNFKGDDILLGEFKHVTITDAKRFSLYGEQL